MSGALLHFWVVTGFFVNLIGAVACTAAAAWIVRRGDAARSDRGPTVAALVLTALWCVAQAAYGTASEIAALAETARNLAWILVIYRLFGNDGRDRSMAAVRPMVTAIAFVECLQPGLVLLAMRSSESAAAGVWEVSAMFRALVAVGALVLLHNLYAGAATGARQVLRWSAAALAGLWAYHLNFYTVAWFTGTTPVELAALRGLVMAAMALLLAVGASGEISARRLSPSRAVAFRSLSLLVIGGYLVAMLLLARGLALLGGDLGRLTQVGFVFGAATVALLWLPSERLRGWLRVTAVKHLFQHRYDYRSEWLRFTDTIGGAGDRDTSLPERAIKALADIAESPGGLLLQPDEEAVMELHARWRWPEIEVPPAALGYELSALLESSGAIVDLDGVRAGREIAGEAAHLPDWLTGNERAWAIVPLLHYERLVGIVVLARPATDRKLDWEDFDLLKVVGRQLASYLAEQSGQQALMEATRFDEFNRRIAFVMHDIKNLASQLSLLARNAEKHADNPAFRADMLTTLRNSAGKLEALLARLGRYGAGGAEKREMVDLAEIARRVAGRYEGGHPVAVTRADACPVLADGEALEQALVHLVHNAIEATEDGTPVYLDAACDGARACIQVIDSGTGMSPEFVRNGLFKPFVSSKNGGFGIGAFEARELIRAMCGRLDVESREGLGTRFFIYLPRSAAAGFISPETQIAEVA